MKQSDIFNCKSSTSHSFSAFNSCVTWEWFATLDLELWQHGFYVKKYLRIKKRRRQKPMTLLINQVLFSFARGSSSQMFFKIGVFKNFANFTGKHLCWSLFLIKLESPRPAKWMGSWRFEIREIFKNTFLQNTSGGCFCFEVRTYATFVERNLIPTTVTKAQLLSFESWNMRLHLRSFVTHLLKYASSISEVL